ncbi:MAG: hypothetical protein WBJ81_01820 [Rickettsiales bacterium]
MSSELTINQSSQINLGSFREKGAAINIAKEYANKLYELNSLQQLLSQSMGAYNLKILAENSPKGLDSPIKSRVDSFQSKVLELKALNNPTDSNKEAIKTHEFFQNLTDNFLGNEKFKCFMEAINITKEAQKLYFKNTEDTQKQLISSINSESSILAITKSLHEASEKSQWIAEGCNYIYNIATSMDNQITAALDNAYNNNNIVAPETALCVGECTSVENDNA